jgi:O-Antigen ligase
VTRLLLSRPTQLPLAHDGARPVAWDLVRIRSAALPILLFLGGLTADFTPLSIFLSLQASDVFLIGAGLLAIPLPLSEAPRVFARFLRANRGVAALAVLGVLFLLGTAASTVVAALSPHAAHTKLYVQSDGFERGVGEWSGNNARVDRTTGAAKGGAYALLVTPWGRTANEGVFGARRPAVPAGHYRLSGWIKSPVGVTIDARIDWYERDHFLGSSLVHAPGTGGFTSVVVAASAPPRTTNAQPVFYTKRTTRRAFYVDGVRFAQPSPVEVGFRAGLDTWLLFAMLFGALVPFTALAVTAHPRGTGALATGLATGATLGAVGYLFEAATTGESFFYGTRSLGIFGSEPFFLTLVGFAILLSHLTGSLVRRSSVPLPSRPRNAWILRGAEAASILVILLALIVSRYRAGWIGAASVFVLVLVVVSKDARIVALALAAAGLVFFSVYRLGGFPHPLTARINRTFDLSQPDIQARREAASRLLKAWTHRPWGLGLDRSPEYLPPKLVEGRNPAVHNLVGHALVEGGPMAALAMAAFPFLLTILWRRSQPARPSRGWHRVWLIAGMWGCVAAAYLSPTLYQRAAWVTVGALVGWTVRRARNVGT